MPKKRQSEIFDLYIITVSRAKHEVIRRVIMNALKIESTGINPLTITIEQAKERYNLGTSTINKIAADANAIIYIGRRKVFLVPKLDRYMEELAN